MTATASATGLRERKRDATRRSIEEAALALAFERGVEDTTVDAIATRAQISTRTFFNYFGSKEDAVLGLCRKDEVADLMEEVARSRRQTSAASVMHLLVEVFGSAIADQVMHHRRAEAIRANPELSRHRLVQAAGRIEALVAAAQQLLPEQPGHEGDGGTARDAELLLGACITAIRVTARANANAGATEDLDAFEQRALQTLDRLAMYVPCQPAQARMAPRGL
jgi:AcrR family transcriptional regulator